MPDLTDTIHLDMLRQQPDSAETGELYGLHWGDPNASPALAWVRDEYCAKFVNPDHVAIEIGPGGGRWTRYMLGFRQLYAIDFHQELLDELGKLFRCPQLTPLKNDGCDFPGIADSSVDFVFSFGVFVHLEFHIIEGYLEEIARVLKPGGKAVIQYADKSKPKAQSNEGFSENYPHKMRRAVLDRGFFIVSENLTVLPHSSIVCFEKPEETALSEGQVFSAG